MRLPLPFCVYGDHSRDSIFNFNTIPLTIIRLNGECCHIGNSPWDTDTPLVQDLDEGQLSQCRHMAHAEVGENIPKIDNE